MKKNSFVFPINTKVELVAVKGERCRRLTTSYGNALDICKKERENGSKWIFKIYQLNYCTIKQTE